MLKKILSYFTLPLFLILLFLLPPRGGGATRAPEGRDPGPQTPTATSTGILGPAPTPVLPPGGNGKIAFQSQRGGNNYDIFTMDPNGENQTNLTFTLFPLDENPDWSPDGTKIAFSSKEDLFSLSDIYVMDADGANVVNLTNNPVEDINPAWSPDGTKIAFATDRSGNWDVYVMDANGSNPINLTNNPASDGFAGLCWSPDGGKIAFTSDRDDGSREIYVMNANGSNPIRLTNRVGQDVNPDWSPDGTKIAFSNYSDSQEVEGDLYVMDADGSNQIDLTPDSSVGDFDPAWAPDGTRIAFTRIILSNFNFEVFVMDSDGSNQVNVSNRPQFDHRPDWQRLAPGLTPTPSPTPTPTPGVTPIPTPTPTATPTLTPGTPTPFPTPILPPAGNGKILFESRSETGLPDIWVMDADGANPINLTNSPAFSDYSASWSPDGTKIAFSSDRDGNSEIYVMNADGSNPIRLTNNSAVEEKPTWSPDGTKIAFSSNRDSNLDIYVMDADGSNLTRLTTDFLDDSRPAWSPDGGKIAFVSTRDGGTEVYLMDANGAHQTNLTNRSGLDSSPAWSPDGTQIAFTSSRNGGGIYVMSPNGANVIRLTPANGSFLDSGAAWSPDGTKIAFHRTLGNNAEIFVMNADGSNQTNVTNNPDLDIRPDWQRLALTPSPTPIATATPGPTATPSATATPGATVTPSATATPSATPGGAAQPFNFSTRMLVQTGDNVGIGGFIIAGSVPKHVVVQAVGPELAQFGVPNFLADPVLELHGPPGFATIINDNCGNTQIAPPPPFCQPGSLSAAIDATLNPGAYTAIVRGKNNTIGVALVEVYDVNQAASSKLANISTRAFIGTADNIVIAGFVLGGNSGDDRILVRGIGPSLTGFGVPNALADPTLELRDNNGTLLASNNDWQDSPIEPNVPPGLQPTNNLESAIVATLPPGLYTALLAGRNNGTGVGLVEVYDLGAP